MRIKKCLWLSAAVLLLCTAVPLPGAPAYSFRRYTTRDGLSSNTVRALIQDRSGLVWMGTNGGLDSFDGRVIVHHPFPSGKVHPIRRILEDRNGVLWLGTENGVFRYQQDGAIRPVEELPPEWVCDLLEDQDGDIWVGMRNRGLFRWSGGKPTQFLDGNDIECLFESADGRIWAASPTGEYRLYIFSGTSESFAPALLDYEGCSPAPVSAMTQDPSGLLWLGTWDRGLYTLDPETRTVRNPVPGGLGFTHIHTLTQIDPWHFMIGSDDGLLDLNPLLGGDGGTLYGNDRRDPASLSSKFVYPVLKDREGGIWIGTYYGGVNYLSPFAGQFDFRSLSELVDAEENYIVSCFCEDPDGTVWMGSDNGGLFRYNPVTGKAQRWKMPMGEDPGPTMNIHAILRTGPDLWVGTFSRGLRRSDLRTGKSRVYLTDDGLLDDSVYSLAQDSEGTLWAGNLTGISRYDASMDKFVPERETGFMTGAILPEADGTIWFATEGKGLLCRCPNGDWKGYTTSSGDLPSDVVRCLLAIPDGICAGTEKGLVLLKEGNGSVMLEGEDIRYAAYDGTQLWISTSSSLIRCSLSTGMSERFGVNDGIPGSLFFPASGLVAHDGRVFLGSLDGFVSFYPGNIRSNTVPPTVLITSFGTTSQNGKEKQEVLFPGNTAPALSWKTRDLRIGFAALSYCAPEKVRYSCRLEGRAPAYWRDLGNQNWVEYSGLPSGKYRLTVIASNNSGVWNREGVSISFAVRPHPLRSGLAIVLYIMVGAALLALGIRFLLRRENRRTQKQYARQLDEAVSLVKEDEMDDRVRLLSSLSSQLEAPVQGIGVQLERIKKHPKATSAVRAEISAIERNQRMLRSVSGSLERMLASIRNQDAEAEQDTPRSPADSAAFLDRLNRIIQDHLADPDLSVSFLVQELAISKSSLFLKVKELTGETPNRLISQARLSRAAALLSEGRQSIAEVAFAVGYSSPSYFTRSFVRQYGMTPHEWVSSHRENRMDADAADSEVPGRKGNEKMLTFTG